jgi:hypothetical protein
MSAPPIDLTQTCVTECRTISVSRSTDVALEVEEKVRAVASRLGYPMTEREVANLAVRVQIIIWGHA